MKSLYDILELEEESSIEQVKHAYYKLAKLYHPDVGGDSGKFEQISEAYKTLSNTEEKQKYDKIRRIFNVKKAKPPSKNYGRYGASSSFTFMGFSGVGFYGSGRAPQYGRTTYKGRP